MNLNMTTSLRFSIALTALMFSSLSYADSCKVVKKERTQIFVTCPRTMPLKEMAQKVNAIAEAMVVAKGDAHVFVFDDAKHTPKSEKAFDTMADVDAEKHELMVLHTNQAIHVRMLTCSEHGLKKNRNCLSLLDNFG
jgi:hypothetical protein